MLKYPRLSMAHKSGDSDSHPSSVDANGDQGRIFALLDFQILSEEDRFLPHSSQDCFIDKWTENRVGSSLNIDVHETNSLICFISSPCTSTDLCDILPVDDREEANHTTIVTSHLTVEFASVAANKHAVSTYKLADICCEQQIQVVSVHCYVFTAATAVSAENTQPSEDTECDEECDKKYWSNVFKARNKARDQQVQFDLTSKQLSLTADVTYRRNPRAHNTLSKKSKHELTYLRLGQYNAGNLL